MAEKIVNGIGRELRYVEYKLRKKGSGNGKSKKNKSYGQQSFGGGSSVPYSDANPPLENVSNEMKNALPRDKSEESLQIQIAMAMSKEEEDEKRKKQESDKIRLELAIKQSLSNAEAKSQEKQQQQQQDLLQLSNPNTSNPAVNNDPWGSTSAPVVTQQAQNDPWGAAAAPTQSAWEIGLTQVPAQAPQPQQDPWGGATTYTAPTTMAAGFNDPWGDSVSKPSMEQDLFSPAPSTQPQMAAWGSLPNTQSNGFTQPAQSTDLFSNTTTTSAAPFDPLGDFDSLRIGDNSMAPVVLSSDATSNIGGDILPLTSTKDANDNNIATNTKKTSSLMNNTQGLVNLDNLLSTRGSNNPYYNTNTKSLGGANAFAPKTTQPSMNQLRGQPMTNTMGTTVSTVPYNSYGSMPQAQPNALYPSLAQQPMMYPQAQQPQVNPFFTPQTNVAVSNNAQQSLF